MLKIKLIFNTLNKLTEQTDPMLDSFLTYNQSKEKNIKVHHLNFLKFLFPTPQTSHLVLCNKMQSKSFPHPNNHFLANLQKDLSCK